MTVEHLERLGYTLLERNARTRHGEIDVIAFEQASRTLAFIEVKTCCVHANTSRVCDQQPLRSLRPRQRARLRRLASAWLQNPASDRPRAEQLRFDAVGVLVDRRGKLLGLEHLEGAW